MHDAMLSVHCRRFVHSERPLKSAVENRSDDSCVHHPAATHRNDRINRSCARALVCVQVPRVSHSRARSNSLRPDRLAHLLINAQCTNLFRPRIKYTLNHTHAHVPNLTALKRLFRDPLPFPLVTYTALPVNTARWRIYDFFFFFTFFMTKCRRGAFVNRTIFNGREKSSRYNRKTKRRRRRQVSV